MRTVGVMVIAAGIGVLLQTVVLQALPFGQPAPDLLLVLCVYLGLHHHGAGGVLGAFLLGTLADSVSGGPLGLNSFAMVVVFLFVYLTSRRLWVDNLISRIVLVLLAAVVKTLAVIALLAVFLRFEESWRGVLWTVAAHGSLTALAAPPVFALLSVTHAPGEDEDR
jgi:rod shape-determining protein MreD